MQTFSDLIDLWPKPAAQESAHPLAIDLGVRPSLIAVWKHRGSIPAEHWRGVVASALKRGIEGVTLDALARLAAEKKGRAA